MKYHHNKQQLIIKSIYVESFIIFVKCIYCHQHGNNILPDISMVANRIAGQSTNRPDQTDRPSTAGHHPYYPLAHSLTSLSLCVPM